MLSLPEMEQPLSMFFALVHTCDHQNLGLLEAALIQGGHVDGLS
jgi:hypothetical protein